MKKKPFKVSKSISKGVLTWLARRGEKIVFKSKTREGLGKLINKKPKDKKPKENKKKDEKKVAKKDEVILKI